MLRKAILLFWFFWVCFAQAQSNPTPFVLNTGNYSFTSWPAASAAGTYPSNMVFHFSVEPAGGAFNPLTIGTEDYNCAYNLSSATRINGLGNGGFSFINTGNGRDDACGTSGSKFVGSSVLALNTTNRNNIQVSWTGGSVAVGDGSPIPRTFVIQLQYRVGTTGSFTNLHSVYTSNTASHSTNFGPETLPEECENQSVVQLRWVYYQTASNNGGTRPRLRVDEISVSSLNSPKITSSLNTIDFGNVMQLTTKTLSLNLGAYNLSPASGNITVTAPTGFQVSTNETTGFANTLNLPYTGEALASTTVYVRFSPTTLSAFSGNLSLSGGSASRNVALTGTGVLPNAVTNLSINRTAPDRMNLTWTRPAGVFGTDWDGVAIFARLNAANTVNLVNIDGTFSGGSNVFGNGYAQDGSFCVSRTTTNTDGNVTITGLSENQNYHFVAFTYKVIPGGSNDVWSLASSQVNAAAVVMNVAELAATPLNEQALLNWTNPFTTSGVWFSEILVVGKAGSDFSFSPTGDGSAYTGNEQFGLGSEVVTGAYVVSKATSSSLTVTGLTNGVNYFFRVYVRNGNSWSTGVLVNVTPNLGNVFYSCGSGNHNTSIWSFNNPACLTTQSITYSNTTNIYIQSGHTITFAGSNVNINNINIESGGSLVSNTTASTPAYFNLFGNITCNGNMGGDNNGLSFNIEDGNHLISGIGILAISRLRKSDENNASGTGTVTIVANMKLSYDGTAIYSNRNGVSFFNVTINEGKTVELIDISGSVSIDGIDGADGSNRGGEILVNGTLIIPNAFFAYTNNNNLDYPCKLTIGSTGWVKTGFLSYNASGSGIGKHILEIKSGGVLEVTNQDAGEAMKNFSSTNNEHIFELGSTIIFSRNGAQNFVNSLPYKNLVFAGSGNKTYSSGNLNVDGNLTIQNTAVLNPPLSSNLIVKGNWTTATEASFNPQNTTVNLNADTLQQIISTHSTLKNNAFHNLSARRLLLNSHLRASGNVSIEKYLDGDVYDMNAIEASSPTALSSEAVVKTKNESGFDGLFALANPTFPNNLTVYFNGNSNQYAGSKMPNQLSKLYFQNTGITNDTVFLTNALQVDDTLFLENGSMSYSNTLNGNATLKMTGGVLEIKNTASTEPGLSGNLIFNGGKVVFSGNGAQTIKATTYRDLEISGTGEKIFSNTDTLTINNELVVNNNSINAAGSVVAFQKTGDLNIPGGFAYNHLVLRNGGTKKLNAPASVLPTGIVSLQNTVLDIDNHTFTLTSDANHNAALGKITGSSNLLNASNFTIQQYISAKAGSRHLSAPIQGMNFNQWKDSVVILGPQTGGFDSPHSSNHSTLRFFDETFNGTLKNSGWKSVLDLSSPLVVGRGYSLIFARKKPSNTLEAVRLSSRGNPQIGSFFLPITFTGSVTEGYNLVANPYPCAIDWDAPSWTKTNIDNAVYRWDVNIGTSGAYFSYVNGIASDGRPNPSVIPSNSAFFVRANASNPVLSLNEEAKFVQASNSSSRQEPFPLVLRLKATDSQNQDYTVIYSSFSKTNNQFCPLSEAYKFMNPRLSLWSNNAEGVDFSIMCLPYEQLKEVMVPLNFSNENKQAVELTVDEFINSSGNDFYLFSKSKNEYLRIEKDEKWSLGINQSNDLFLVSKTENVLSINAKETSEKFSIFPNPFQHTISMVVDKSLAGGKVRVVDMLGNHLLSFEATSGFSTLDLSSLEAGLYMIVIEKDGMKQMKKLVKN